MRTKLVFPDPAILFQRLVSIVRNQSRLVWASYGCALIGARLAIHDFHHYDFDRQGLSTVFVGAAIVLYVLGQRRPVKRVPPRPRR